uniref:PAP-associated domain-containing protein n=1 Tax=Strongyloides papillosus TaxID=174720 RepID=A0A0N5C701_STREA
MDQKYLNKLLLIYGKPPFTADIDNHVNDLCRRLEELHINEMAPKSYKRCGGKKLYYPFKEKCKSGKSFTYTKCIVNQMDLECRCKLDWLTEHIERSYYKDCQKKTTFLRKCKIVRCIEKLLKSLEPTSFIFLTGSTITNLGDNSSDVDICWVIPGHGVNNLELSTVTELNFIHEKLYEAEKNLIEMLSEKDVIETTSVIESKVPLLKIKFKRRWYNVEVDISVNNLPGAMNSKLLHYYSRYDIRYSQLVLYFKNFCKESGYKDAQNYYLNSYSISLMVLHFLQAVVDPPILPNLQRIRPDIFSNYKLLWFPFYQDICLPPITVNKMPISELYIKFLKYFGRFDSLHCGISIAKGCLLPRELFAKNNKNYPLFIEEPFERENTARSLKTDQWNDIKRNMIHEVSVIIKESKKF